MTVGDLRKIETRYKHTRYWLWYITAICFVTGALLAVCIRTQKEWRTNLSIPSWRPEIIAEHLRVARAEIMSLRAEIKDLRGQVDAYQDKAAHGDQAQELVKAELDKYKVLVGLTPMEGPGLVITVTDSSLLKAASNPEDKEGLMVHDLDIQRLVNELRGAGAEAVSINGQRVVERTAIRCVGPVMQVNNTPIGAPYTISAVGDPDVLSSGVNIPGGILDTWKTLSFPVTLKKETAITLPAYSGPVDLRKAHPVLAHGSRGD